MSNPSQSTNTSTGEINTSPMWYVWFYKAYWPAWWFGTILIALSWFGIVTPTVGWAGFALSGAATLGSFVLPSLAGVKPEEYVMLDSRLLKSKCNAYHDAIARFRNGATQMYDGVAFGFRPINEIACGIVADTTDLDDTSVSELAGYAQSVFDKLSAESIEFASAVNGRTFRISIMSRVDHSARELCRVVDGQLDWRR